MKRVVLYRNGSTVDGKVFLVGSSLEELLHAATLKFGMHARKIFTPNGGEIDDIQLIREDDVLYVSSGEQFVGALPASGGRATGRPGGPSPAEWVLLNVGGRRFATTRAFKKVCASWFPRRGNEAKHELKSKKCSLTHSRASSLQANLVSRRWSTLVSKEPLSMLARMFSDAMWPSVVDSDGAYLIDRCPAYFEPILNYLRHGQLILDKNVSPQGVLEEAKFFGIESLVPLLEQMVQKDRGPGDHSPLTRRDVIDILASTSHLSELRFQSVNLSGADLSRLDLRHINFKYSNLQGARLTGANLSYCCLERADLSLANLEGAVLVGSKAMCANMEGAILRSCNMEDPAGNSANLEGVNLKNANLENSQMAGVNLRVATLKNANLQNCHLRQAVLAGADLENCNLSGSDLHEANLRGANLKDATMELMLTPLHMAQAIR